MNSIDLYKECEKKHDVDKNKLYIDSFREYLEKSMDAKRLHYGYDFEPVVARILAVFWRRRLLF